MLRACLMASVSRRWCGAHTPEMRRGTILPRSAMKRVQQPHVLVVDVVDLLDAEAAHLLAPEILLLAGRDRLVAAGGPLRRADGSSPFCSAIGFPLTVPSPPSATGAAAARRLLQPTATAERLRAGRMPASAAPEPELPARAGTAGAAATGAGRRLARFSRFFFRFSSLFSFSSMRTVMNLITRSVTRRRRSTSFTDFGPGGELDQHVEAFAVLVARGRPACACPTCRLCRPCRRRW